MVPRTFSCLSSTHPHGLFSTLIIFRRPHLSWLSESLGMKTQIGSFGGNTSPITLCLPLAIHLWLKLVSCLKYAFLITLTFCYLCYVYVCVSE